VRAVVRYLGTDNIWLEDVANPIGAFSTSEYQSMSVPRQTELSHLRLLLTSPAITRIVLISKEVNKAANVLGFVWGGDLVPAGQCPSSNVGEVFFGLAPDPAGVYGQVWSKADVSTEYRALMAHELTHVIQLGRQVYSGAGSKATWELEGGATLSEQLVGFRVYGYASGQNLGLTSIVMTPMVQN
jgi:hypothetical protein